MQLLMYRLVIVAAAATRKSKSIKREKREAGGIRKTEEERDRAGSAERQERERGPAGRRPAARGG